MKLPPHIRAEIRRYRAHVRLMRAIEWAKRYSKR